MKTLMVAAVAALATHVAAECPNACSGNGECLNKDQCQCYDNFFGSDCSLKRCPSALAFVDVPNGDLNHDGSLGRRVAGVSEAYSKVQWSKYMQAEYWPTVQGTIARDANGNVLPVVDGGGYAAQNGEAHWYTECSGKGVCDRSSGECQCYDGYTGSACQRTTCPNDCSGHGLCRQVADIAQGALNKKFVDSASGVNTYSGVQDAFAYNLWDADKNSACVCDLGYSGVDCSLRECPRGDDPLTAVAATCAGGECVNEIQGFTLSQTTAATSKYFIEFFDFDGNVWRTDKFLINHNEAYSVNAKRVADALKGLPNSLIGSVNVAAEKKYGNHVRYTVTFTSLSGNVPEFVVKRDTTTAAMEPIVQPYEPVQYITFPAALANAATEVFIDPQDVSAYRSTQLTNSYTMTAATVAELTKVFVDAGAEGVGALEYELGTSGVDVVASTANPTTDFMVIFKNNVNKPGAAKKMGYNPIRIRQGAGAFATITKDARDGVTEYSICSNRGVCDYSTGLCACFPGYTDAACNAQKALAQ